MFVITEGDFKNQIYGDEDYLSNWPMLYILENGKQAYIGESNHVKNRMSQHHNSVDKRIFDKVHFIYSSKFNQSVTFDYESKLIQYIVADELFEVRNKNAGTADKEYCGKKEYDEKFQVLWRKLQREKIVKHSLEELENSDLFKYSPYKELNNDQRAAVEEIIDSLKQEENQTVVVNGMPGSGKTIVAIFLLKYLKDSEEFQDKKIGFVVPQTSLRKTLKGIFKSIYGLKASDILSPSDVTKQFYDILLVDEAHRLHQYKNISYMGAFKASCERIGLTTEGDELDWILHQCKCPVLFYDEMQVVGPSGIDVKRFRKKMENEQAKRMMTYYNLLTQMRVKGGNDYIAYVKSILSGNVKEKKTFSNYELKLMTDFKAFNERMYQKQREVYRIKVSYRMKSFEIEIKLPVSSLEEIKEKLILNGFQEGASIRESDMYYNSEYHDVKKLGEAIRIRKSTDLLTGQMQAQLNFKGKKIDQVSMSRQEYETVVENPECMEKILIALGFSPVAGVQKTRCYMKQDEMTACLDQVDGLGSFLELEVIAAEESMRETYLQRMEGLLAELGLSMGETVRTSYLSMLCGENETK